MLVAGIAVAQVEAALGAGRHEIDQPGEAAGHAVDRIGARMAGHDAFEQRELDRRLPLDRQPVRRNRGHDPVQLLAHRPAVGLLEQGARRRHDIDARHRERRRQADLEAHAGRDGAFVCQPFEDLEGVDGRVGVAEVGQLDLVGRGHALDQRVGRHRDIDRIDLDRPELRALADARMLPLDPAVALADLAVGQAPEMRAEMRRRRAEHLLGARIRRAADEVDRSARVAAIHAMLPVRRPTVSSRRPSGCSGRGFIGQRAPARLKYRGICITLSSSSQMRKPPCGAFRTQRTGCSAVVERRSCRHAAGGDAARQARESSCSRSRNTAACSPMRNGPGAPLSNICSPFPAWMRTARPNALEAAPRTVEF